jgi:hypothetical protein
MIPPLDVFALKDGKPQWLGYAETLAKALELAGKNGLGSYFVFSQETGHKTFYEISANGVVSRLLAPA